MSTTYITVADLTDRFGEEEIALLAEAGGDNAVDMAISDASEEAESYVAVNYTAPLPNIPAPLKSAVADIARFRLYKDRATEDVKYRYEAAIKWLVRLADDKVKLTFSPALTTEQEEAIVTPSDVAQIGLANGGIFSDELFTAMPGADIDLIPRSPYRRWF